MLGEAISHVRTSLMLSTSGGPPRTLLVASPNPQEGKTTLSLNLASAMAMDKSCKVLIIDCDLRKPRIHQVLQESHQPGLSNFLTGSASLAEVIRPTPIPNLFFIPAGPIPPNPVQLLVSQAFKDLLANLRKDYHHIVFDVPPIIGFADGRVISQLVDGTLLVVRNHHTSRDAAKLAINLLNQAQANILGVVLNMAHKGRLGYGGYYEYYKYYSRYYKGYYSDQ
jgi:succinoglycan biosynthesis transport protein ExoP